MQARSQNSDIRRPIDAEAIQSVVAGTRTVLLTGLASAVSGYLLGIAAVAVSHSAMPLWLLARSAGISAYVLLTLVTAMGMLLSHKTRARLRPSAARIRLHLGLVVFTLAFTVMHIVVLVLDPYAKVGLAGAFLPLGAAYRPVPVTLGLLALWSGLIAGVSAALAGRGTGRVWLYLHRFAASAWLLAWAHAVMTGIDTAALVGMYTVSGLAILAIGLWRYLSREHAVIEAQQDRHAEVVR